MDKRSVISHEQAARIVDLANLGQFQPTEVAQDYVPGTYDIMISGTREQCAEHLIVVKAMIASGKIKNADLRNVKMKIIGEGLRIV